jgi:DNA polymerase
MPYPASELIWKEYHQDQEINDRGVLLDQDLISSAIKIDRSTSAQLKDEMKAITGLDNPGSVTQLKEWLADRGIEATTLGKKAVLALIDQTHGDVQKVLKLRQISAKSSIKKYEAMKRSANADHRARGLFQFFGAPRTGRFAGRRIQLQNLPQNHIPDLTEARQLVRDGNPETVAALYDNVPDTLSQLLRTALIPKPGFKFIVSDFSAIEARVLSWIAGERWRMEVFAQNGDIYCASASQMFGVPVVKHGVNGELRQKGKIAELALGYGGSVGALKSMGALEMGLSEEELPGLVRSWRKTNPRIVDFWWQVDAAVKDTVRTGRLNRIAGAGITTRYDGRYLKIGLPSGRSLFYPEPAFGENRFGGECVTYMGLDTARHWSRIDSYGPKFVENIIQGISRDILCEAMLRMRALRIVGHVHDEVIIEAPKSLEVETINQIMAETPSWAPGPVLNADGYECHFYQKD